MWKKNSEDNIETPVNSVADPVPMQRQPVGEQAVIGSSLIVKGDLLGEEDLLIQGQVEGKIVLKKNSITVGKHGIIKADLYGKIIVIEGTVQGNLFGDEKIIIRKSGDVKGNLIAPRVNLEDGAKFKGSIDMEGNPPPDNQRPLPGTSSSSKSAKNEKGSASSTDTSETTVSSK